MNKDIDISNVLLETERLELRPFNETDLNDFFEYAKVDGVGEKAGWTHHKDIEETKKILDTFIERKNIFAIRLNNKTIGSIGIEKYNENLFPNLNNLEGREIGFVLSKDYWGKGIMTEAVKEVINYLFNDVKLDFITCGYFIDNLKSKRVQEKLGFIKTLETILKSHDGVEHKTVVNILTYDMYIKNSQI